MYVTDVVERYLYLPINHPLLYIREIQNLIYAEYVYQVSSTGIIKKKIKKSHKLLMIVAITVVMQMQ